MADGARVTREMFEEFGRLDAERQRLVTELLELAPSPSAPPRLVEVRTAREWTLRGRTILQSRWGEPVEIRLSAEDARALTAVRERKVDALNAMIGDIGREAPGAGGACGSCAKWYRNGARGERRLVCYPPAEAAPGACGDYEEVGREA